MCVPDIVGFVVDWGCGVAVVVRGSGVVVVFVGPVAVRGGVSLSGVLGVEGRGSGVVVLDISPKSLARGGRRGEIGEWVSDSDRASGTEDTTGLTGGYGVLGKPDTGLGVSRGREPLVNP